MFAKRLFNSPVSTKSPRALSSSSIFPHNTPRDWFILQYTLKMADDNVVEMLKHSMAESRHINSTELAGATLMIFDWFLNFTLEVESIWKAKWNAIKVVYLIARYLPLAFIPLDLFYIFTGSLSIPGCVGVYDAITVLYVVGLLAAEFIFTIRTVAVWGKDKHVTYILFTTFGAMCIVIPTLIGINLSRTTQGLVGFREFIQGQCTPISGKSYKFLVATFTFTAAYDTMILTFMMARAFSTSRWRVDSYLFKTIYGDGVAFYIYIFGVSLVNIIFIFTTSSFFLLLQASFHSILACRVVLHIRQHLSEPDSQEVSLNRPRRTRSTRAQTGSQLSI